MVTIRNRWVHSLEWQKYTAVSLICLLQTKKRCVFVSESKDLHERAGFSQECQQEKKSLVELYVMLGPVTPDHQRYTGFILFKDAYTSGGFTIWLSLDVNISENFATNSSSSELPSVRHLGRLGCAVIATKTKGEAYGCEVILYFKYPVVWQGL